MKIFTSRALATVLAEIGPAFEATSGHKLDIVVDLTPTLVRRVRAGESVDIIVALPKLIDDLIKEGTQSQIHVPISCIPASESKYARA